MIARCRGWIAIVHDTLDADVEQCDAPAVNGRHCAEHLEQIPVEWIPDPATGK